MICLGSISAVFSSPVFDPPEKEGGGGGGLISRTAAGYQASDLLELVQKLLRWLKTVSLFL